MTVSTDGEICYGILLDEDTELPWRADEYDQDIEAWWTYGIQGFRHTFEMFTPEGDWIGGKEWPKERIDEYYDEIRQFRATHPKLPIVEVNACSISSPLYIIAIPESRLTARRGFPVPFDPALLVAEGWREKLKNFCIEHGLSFSEPSWYLSSFWEH